MSESPIVTNNQSSEGQISQPPFTTVLVDPPWKYDDKLRMSTTRRGADDQYHTMSVDDIKRFPRTLPFRFATPGFLWLWVTNPFLLDGSGAAVCRAWGYEPKQLVTWVKGAIVMGKLQPSIGMGRYTRGATEHIIVGTRGHATELVLARNVPNVILAPRQEHSAKPDAQYPLIESLCPGPYLELFARYGRTGWTSHGDQVDKDMPPMMRW